MKPTTALICAIALGAAAVGLVMADLAFNVELTLEGRNQDGSWQTLSSSGASRYASYSRETTCESSTFRLTVDNGHPWGITRHVRFGYQDADSREHWVVDETWSLGAGESRMHELTIPDAAFNRTLTRGDDLKPYPASISVQARLGEHWENAVSTYCRGLP